MDFRERYGPWACVAGASKGIGLALSIKAAARGLNVVMVARRQGRLHAMAAEIAERYDVEVRTVVADLASPDVAETLAAATSDIEVGLFVYNAAGAPVGRFIDVTLPRKLQAVATNCATPVALCDLFAPPMVERGRGGIALVNSNGGAQGSVNFSTYNAGKAFEWILAETLWAELGEHGVDVTTIFVGPTTSPGFVDYQSTLDQDLCRNVDSDDLLDRARARLMDPSSPEEVATALYDQLADGPVCFSRAEDAWIYQTSLSLPRSEAVRAWVGLQQTSKPDAQTLDRWSRAT